MAQHLPLSMIRCADQHRSVFDPVKLQELADNIRENGLLQPIEVRPDPDGEGYLVTFGERRLRAHQLLGAETILAEVVDREDFRPAQAIENLLREQADPVDEGRSHLRSMAAFLQCDTDEGRSCLLRQCRSGKWPEEAEAHCIARCGGHSTRNLRARIGLLWLPEAVQDMVHSGELALSAANILVGMIRDLPDRDLRAELQDLALKAARGQVDTEKLGDLVAGIKAQHLQTGFGFDEDPVAQRRAQVARNNLRRLETAMANVARCFWNDGLQCYEFDGLNEADRERAGELFRMLEDARAKMSAANGTELVLCAEQPPVPVEEHENPELNDLEDATAEVLRLTETETQPSTEFLTVATTAIGHMREALALPMRELGATLYADWTGLSVEDRKRRAAEALRDDDHCAQWSLFTSYHGIYGRKRQAASRDTLVAYRRAVECLWVWCERNATKPHQLTREAANRIVRDWQAEGLRPATCNLRMAACRAFCEAIRWAGMMTDNAFAVPAVQETVPQHLKREGYSDEEVSAILAVADPTERAMVLLAADGALRASEIGSLRVADVDTAHRRLVVWAGKGGKTRDVLLTQRLADALDALPPAGGERVFRLPEHTARQALYHVLQACAQRAGVTERGVHAFRHNCLTRLYRETHDLLVTARHGGHTSTRTTEQYIARNDSDYAQAVSALG